MKPGIYKGLKPTECIILDTGSYTFIGLEMKDLGKGIWLDARKARRVTLLSCHFVGNGKGTGIKAAQDLSVEKCTFRNLEFGIMLVNPIPIKRKAGKTTLKEAMVSITANVFANNREAIMIARPKTNLENFRCNEFTTNGTKPHIGLHIGVEPGNTETPTGALSGAIGNDGDGSPLRPDPSGNVWPIDPATLAAHPVTHGLAALGFWISPVNWTSLKNDNTNFNLVYWAYNNEFVWADANNGPNATVRKRDENGEQIRVYRTGISNPPVDDPGVVVYRAQCTTDLPDVFPLRMAVHPSGDSLTSSLDTDIGQGRNALLGDAIPNPASSNVIIPVFIPEQSGKKYKLSIFDLSGKKVFSEVSVGEKGRVKVDLPLTGLPAGVYGYSLTENGKMLGARKLVIIK